MCGLEDNPAFTSLALLVFITQTVVGTLPAPSRACHSPVHLPFLSGQLWHRLMLTLATPPSNGWPSEHRLQPQNWLRPQRKQCPRDPIARRVSSSEGGRVLSPLPIQLCKMKQGGCAQHRLHVHLRLGHFVSRALDRGSKVVQSALPGLGSDQPPASY